VHPPDVRQTTLATTRRGIASHTALLFGRRLGLPHAHVSTIKQVPAPGVALLMQVE